MYSRQNDVDCLSEAPTVSRLSRLLVSVKAVKSPLSASLSIARDTQPTRVVGESVTSPLERTLPEALQLLVF